MTSGNNARGVDMLFKNRNEAGKHLAARLVQYRESSPVILALPRGGVVVAGEVTRALGAPLDVVIARKLSAPRIPGFGIGALAEGGVRVIDTLAVRMLGVAEEQLARVESAGQAEIAKYLELYRGDRPFLDVKDRTVILVDDGLASGLTARAAIEAVARRGPKRIILAVPVSGPDVAAAMLKWVDDFICVGTPPDFLYVNDGYENYDDCPDSDVFDALDAARRRPPSVTPYPLPCSPHFAGDEHPADTERTIKIETHMGPMEGSLEIPQASRGVVLLAHGAGSNRNSPRSRVVSESLVRAKLATLRIDLLTTGEQVAEAETQHLRFNVGLLTERVCAATRWLSSHPMTQNLRIGYFGASIGASAMFAAAAKLGGIAAIVSRGGRPDWVEPRLPGVHAAALLIVGGHDSLTLERNQRVFEQLGSAEKKIMVIEGAGHLFEESGAMERVAQLASDWLSRHLSRVG